MTNKEAAERIYKALEFWDYISDKSKDPDGFCAATDHCHMEYWDAMEVADILSEKGESYFGD